MLMRLFAFLMGQARERHMPGRDGGLADEECEEYAASGMTAEDDERRGSCGGNQEEARSKAGIKRAALPWSW